MTPIDLPPEKDFKLEQVYRDLKAKGLLLSREEVCQTIKPLLEKSDENEA
jgi:hypothetical protein